MCWCAGSGVRAQRRRATRAGKRHSPDPRFLRMHDVSPPAGRAATRPRGWPGQACDSVAWLVTTSVDTRLRRRRGGVRHRAAHGRVTVSAQQTPNHRLSSSRAARLRALLAARSGEGPQEPRAPEQRLDGGRPGTGALRLGVFKAGLGSNARNRPKRPWPGSDPGHGFAGRNRALVGSPLRRGDRGRAWRRLGGPLDSGRRECRSVAGAARETVRPVFRALARGALSLSLSPPPPRLPPETRNPA